MAKATEEIARGNLMMKLMKHELEKSSFKSLCSGSDSSEKFFSIAIASAELARLFQVLKSLVMSWSFKG